jgi:hypothetical protein
MARALDWLEVKIRNGSRIGMTWWRQATVTAKSALILLAAFAIAGAGYGGYVMMFG